MKWVDKTKEEPRGYFQLWLPTDGFLIGCVFGRHVTECCEDGTTIDYITVANPCGLCLLPYEDFSHWAEVSPRIPEK